MKIVFVVSIIRNELCIIHAFFFSKIIYRKLFPYCCDKFEYLRSIVYFSCSTGSADKLSGRSDEELSDVEHSSLDS